MKTMLVLGLVPLVVSCHVDSLFTGSGNGPPLSHGTPASLAFSARPGPARAGQPLDPVRVAVVDSAGTPIAEADSLITIGLGVNPTGATLSGTDTARATNGVATFRDLQIDRSGTGYRLTASGGGLPPQDSDPFDVMPAPPTTGSVTVTTATTGATPDPDGYTVTVTPGATQPIGLAGTVTFGGLDPGSHTVALSGLAGNCSVTGAVSRNVTVTVGDTASVSFSVSCPTPPPTTGSLRVTTNTTGASPDPDGYTVTVDGVGGASRPIGSAETITFTDLAVGSHGVVLSGIANNCTVTGGGPSQTVNITAGVLETASFSIDCPTPPPPPDQPPVVTAGGNQHVPVGLLFTLQGASFSDPDHDAPWTVSIDWGDGSSPRTFETSNEGSIGGTHSYPVTLLGASYTLRITVRDAHGLSHSATKTVFVDTL